MGIETIYMFDKGSHGEKDYIREMFDKLTTWMTSKGYGTDKEIGIYEVFTQGNNINTHYDTLEDLYANFKFLVSGFVNYQNTKSL